MKSAKTVRQQYGNTERGKSGKRSEKLSKLDRKSSRGMIYENEELRLRTININAEVERGQTDIKRLRKENEQLRREIWGLRDECDRLNKRVKAKFIEHDQGVYNVRCSGGNGCSCQCNEGSGGCDAVHCKYNSEESDSCDSCCCHEEDETPCTDDCCNETKKLPDIAEHEQTATVFQNTNSKAIKSDGPATGPSLLTNFDHLSVVSEETLSNSEVALAHQSENLLGYTPGISGSSTTLPSLVCPLTPLTPIELVANELNDLQAVMPPLSYFENILSQHMHSNHASTPESSCTTFSGKTIAKHTNGWDYNLESPFAQRRYQANSISPIMNKRPTAQTLTTFVPTTTVTPPPSDKVKTSSGKPTLPKKPSDLSITTRQNLHIETVPITTMPANGCVTTTHNALINNNGEDAAGGDTADNDGNTTPKHFFAPIKPKLKLNTALANQKRLPAPPKPPSVSSTSTSSSSSATATKSYTNGALVVQPAKCEPPDIYVTNALASPYKPPNKPTMQPPPIPQRIASTTSSMQQQAQVSSSSPQHQRNNNRQQPHHCRQQQQQHQIHHYQHQRHNYVADVTNNDVYEMTTICNASTTTTTATTNTLCPTTIPSRSSSMSETNLKTLLTDTTNVLTSNTLCNSLNSKLTTLAPITNTTLTTMTTTASLLTSSFCCCPPSPATPACYKFINSNINFRKPNDPVYAIAQNVCHNLITAPAVTQPLMSSIVKCCLAKQQELQQLITAASLPSPTPSSSATATCHCNSCIVSIQPTPLLLPSAILSSCISCNLTINSSLKTKPITGTNTTTTTKTLLTTSTTSTNCIVVDSMCQTDSANLESILNDIEAISEDILAIQLVKNKSRENLNNKPMESVGSTTNPPLQQNNKNTKPYRSEMNLLLTYDGDNPTIKQAVITRMENNLETGSNTSTATRRTRSLERDHTDSPSPHIPDPMQPFPENRKYIGFDRINRAAVIATTTAPLVAATATQTTPLLNSPLSQRAQLPLSPLVTNVNTPKSSNGKSLPPVPPTRVYPPPLNIKCAGIARSSSVTGVIPTTECSTNSNGLNGVPPNKSQLYAALANAAAKRAQFRSQPTYLTQSLDKDQMPEENDDEESKTPTSSKTILSKSDNGIGGQAPAMENAKRKARRVSIVCADTDSPESPDKPIPAVRCQSATLSPQTSGSCSDLQAILQNPALRSMKQISQSTPNSPHSSRKHDGSPLGNVPPAISVTPSSTPQHQRSSSNGLQQQQAAHHVHSSSYPNVVSPLTQQHQQPRKNSQDTIKASAAEIACAAANAMRSKCSRRHSDSNVSHTNQRISGASAGTNGGHHHGHHNHHHHQHSSSVVSATNPHHSHHSRQDSNQETAASYSDRNSNSLASSRESSASFSMRSQRRKLSVSSHTGGKIPWCGCWGNGCL